MTYDLDGNLTNDETFQYDDDAENRLISATPLDTASGLKKIESGYDYMSRRVQKQVYTYDGSSWVLETEKSFVYDGWNLIKETTTDSGTSTDFYVWGLDVSGSLQGAGGIGGLLSTTNSLTSTTYLYTFDANGNVGQLVDASNGTIAAHYEYDSFGKLLVSTGSEADSNVFRFSTKYYDVETGLYYYGYRYYSSKLGRWPTRDPIGEVGGLNLYGFIRNNSINFYDPLGLTTVAEILEAFFSSSTTERLWDMGENDEYTGKMRQWKVVQDNLNVLKWNLLNNCETWGKTHRTDPSWKPGYTDPPDTDPNAAERWVNSPPGTDPDTAAKAWKSYNATGVIPEPLWYAAVGSFGIYVTVNEIDCCKKTAILNIWLYNSMDQDSFGFINVLGYRLLTPGRQGMARQYMWWHWTEEFSWVNTNIKPPEKRPTPKW